MFDREIYLLVVSLDSCFEERIEVIPPVENIHRSRGGHCSLWDVIFLHPPPCFPVEAKRHTSIREILEKVYGGFLSSNTDRGVSYGKRTTLHPLWITALNNLAGKQGGTSGII